MQTKGKTIIHLILTGMVILNLLLAFFVLAPPNPAKGAVRVESRSHPYGVSSVRLSPIQQFLKMDQAARKFWTDLLPFWDE